jgi:hypothetical protein
MRRRAMEEVMRNPMRTAIHLCLSVAIVGAVAYSAGDGATGPAGGTQPPESPETPGNISGTYKLSLVNDGPLPALLWYDQTAADMDAEMYILSGSIILRPDGTFRSTMVNSLTIEGVSDLVSTSITDGTYRFEPDAGDPTRGVVGLTAENGGAEFGLYFADFSIRAHAMIPGTPGEPDVEVVKLYIR